MAHLNVEKKEVVEVDPKKQEAIDNLMNELSPDEQEFIEDAEKKAKEFQASEGEIEPNQEEQKEEEKVTPEVVKPEDEVKKEEKVEPEKKDTLEEQLTNTLEIGVSKESEQESDDPDVKYDKVVEENADLKRKLYNTNVAKVIGDLLSSSPEEEAEVLIKGIEGLLKSDATKGLGKELPAEQRAAMLISMARGNTYSELLKIKETESTKNKENKEVYKELITSGKPVKEVAQTKEQQLDDLRKRVTDGDETAGDELMARTSPEIDFLDKLE